MPVLLATKLHLPQVDPEVILRPRLLEQLTRGLDCNVTLISAPAGYGKTTLAATWLQAVAGAELRATELRATPLRAAWYSVDETDDDPIIFFLYFTAALRMLFPGACPQAHAMASQLEHASAEQLAVTLAAECLLLPAKVLFVLDDLHLVTNPVIHRVLTHLVRYASSRLHLLALTRSDPPWPVARMRAQRQLSEVRVHDLQFTRAETSGLFAVTFERPLDQTALERLHHQTEGWVAGLQLAAIGLQARASSDGERDDFGHGAGRYTVDYLVDEALESQPPAVQRFLLATALLDRFTAPLAAQVLGDVDEVTCTELLAEIERRNLFVTPLDDTRTWYRYHHQFAEMLRMRGRFTEAERTSLHLRAAEWLAANGSQDEAMPHYVAAGAYSNLIGLIERQLTAIYNANRWHDLGRWLAHLPDKLKFSRPLLILAQCTLLEQESRTEGIAALLERAKELLAGPDHGLEDEQRHLAHGQIYLLSGETLPDLSAELRATYAQRALDVLPKDQYWLRGSAFIELAMWLGWLGRRVEARAQLRTALVSLSPESEELQLRLKIALGAMEFQGGSMLELRRYSEEILQARAGQPLTFTSTTAHYGLGAALHQLGEPEQARKHLELAVDWSNLSHRQIQLGALYTLLLLDCATGNSGQAATVMRNFRRFAAWDGSPLQAELVASLEALAALIGGDLAAAARWATQPVPVDWVGSFDHRLLIHVRILLAQAIPASLARAHDLLTDYRQQRAAQHQAREWIEASVLLCQVAWRQGSHAEALDLLAEAIGVGFPLGYRQWFVEPSNQAGALLQALALTGRCQGEIAVLLTLLDAKVQQAAPRIRQMVTTPEGELIEPLTERELAVLSALGQRLSNKEIARSMGVSPLTVRNHTSHIYAKLRVSGRRQAIARAQALGLLQHAPA